MVTSLTNFSFHPFHNYHLRVGNELSTKQKCCHNIFFLSSYMHLQNEAFAITNNQKVVCKIHGDLPKTTLRFF